MGRPGDGTGAGEISTLLHGWSDGNVDAFERLVPLVYQELHRLAARTLNGDRTATSLQATALVHEACVRLLGWDAVRWQDRGHFFGVSAQIMRRVLVDIARKRQAERRGGPFAVRVPLEGLELPASEPHTDVLAVDAALRLLALEDQRKARVVELRFFGGLTIEETAVALEVSARTVYTDWAFARAWLFRTLSGVHAD